MRELILQHQLRSGAIKWIFRFGKRFKLALFKERQCPNLLSVLLPRRPADAANTNVDIFTSILEKSSENLLHDDLEALADHCTKLREKGGGNVDIIVDNAGFELITDLALAQYLVQSEIASCVTFQLKSHVSWSH